ncbi:hypothetical protein GGS23DRAFT_595482 [Durotheca rogersii]|uniref:uncharacterized protein n=1 Tax=Durotheca rogersii TaxID=419775 RepID=UPI0022207700|nr:uncharacterized protein GGS23DRAFT_595482 [Durotheca rogersii]KAI5864784.1 hypothetical protein GGS23DRAFT_595482 [Durotheca rogersii]
MEISLEGDGSFGAPKPEVLCEPSPSISAGRPRRPAAQAALSRIRNANRIMSGLGETLFSLNPDLCLSQVPTSKVGLNPEGASVVVSPNPNPKSRANLSLSMECRFRFNPTLCLTLNPKFETNLALYPATKLRDDPGFGPGLCFGFKPTHSSISPLTRSPSLGLEPRPYPARTPSKLMARISLSLLPLLPFVRRTTSGHDPAFHRQAP